MTSTSPSVADVLTGLVRDEGMEAQPPTLAQAPSEAFEKTFSRCIDKEVPVSTTREGVPGSNGSLATPVNRSDSAAVSIQTAAFDPATRSPGKHVDCAPEPRQQRSTSGAILPAFSRIENQTPGEVEEHSPQDSEVQEAFGESVTEEDSRPVQNRALRRAVERPASANSRPVEDRAAKSAEASVSEEESPEFEAIRPRPAGTSSREEESQDPVASQEVWVQGAALFQASVGQVNLTLTDPAVAAWSENSAGTGKAASENSPAEDSATVSSVESQPAAGSNYFASRQQSISARSARQPVRAEGALHPDGRFVATGARTDSTTTLASGQLASRQPGVAGQNDVSEDNGGELPAHTAVADVGRGTRGTGGIQIPVGFEPVDPEVEPLPEWLDSVVPRFADSRADSEGIGANSHVQARAAREMEIPGARIATANLMESGRQLLRGQSQTFSSNPPVGNAGPEISAFNPSTFSAPTGVSETLYDQAAASATPGKQAGERPVYSKGGVLNGTNDEVSPESSEVSVVGSVTHANSNPNSPVTRGPASSVQQGRSTDAQPTGQARPVNRPEVKLGDERIQFEESFQRGSEAAELSSSNRIPGHAQVISRLQTSKLTAEGKKVGGTQDDSKARPEPVSDPAPNVLSSSTGPAPEQPGTRTNVIRNERHVSTVPVNSSGLAVGSAAETAEVDLSTEIAPVKSTAAAMPDPQVSGRVSQNLVEPRIVRSESLEYALPDNSELIAARKGERSASGQPGSWKSADSQFEDSVASEAKQQVADSGSGRGISRDDSVKPGRIPGSTRFPETRSTSTERVVETIPTPDPERELFEFGAARRDGKPSPTIPASAPSRDQQSLEAPGRGEFRRVEQNSRKTIVNEASTVGPEVAPLHKNSELPSSSGAEARRENPSISSAQTQKEAVASGVRSKPATSEQGTVPSSVPNQQRQQREVPAVGVRTLASSGFDQPARETEPAPLRQISSTRTERRFSDPVVKPVQIQFSGSRQLSVWLDPAPVRSPDMVVAPAFLQDEVATPDAGFAAVRATSAQETEPVEINKSAFSTEPPSIQGMQPRVQLESAVRAIARDETMLVAASVQASTGELSRQDELGRVRGKISAAGSTRARAVGSGVNGTGERGQSVSSSKALNDPVFPMPRLDLNSIPARVEPEETAIRTRGSGTSLFVRTEQDGTPIAQEEERMKNELKTNQIAGVAEQKMPGTEMVQALGSDLRSAPGKGRKTAVGGGDETGSAQSISLAGFANGPRQISEATGEFFGQSRTALSPVENLILEVSKQAVELKQFQADSMAVSLKPDANTEILLHLRNRDGVVEVHARFERGDYQVLNGQWEQLQSSLAGQGIRVGPLIEAHPHLPLNPQNGFMDGSRQQGQGRERGREESPGSPKNLDELTLVGSVTEPLRRRGARAAGARRVWESWA